VEDENGSTDNGFVNLGKWDVFGQFVEAGPEMIAAAEGKSYETMGKRECLKRLFI